MTSFFDNQTFGLQDYEDVEIQGDWNITSFPFEEFENGSSSLNMKFESGFVDSEEIFICCLINILIEIFGNGLLVLMIINETMIVKPRERTVNNRLITYMCWHYILNNIIGAPIVTYTIIVNDIGKFSKRKSFQLN